MKKRLIYFGGAGAGAPPAAVIGLAVAGHSPAHAASQPVKAVQAASVQPAATSEPAATAPDTDTVNDTTTPDTTTEPAGAAESATASDGPGGHEDNPADANAAHDFQGN